MVMAHGPLLWRCGGRRGAERPPGKEAKVRARAEWGVRR